MPWLLLNRWNMFGNKWCVCRKKTTTNISHGQKLMTLVIIFNIPMSRGDEGDYILYEAAQLFHSSFKHHSTMVLNIMCIMGTNLGIAFSHNSSVYFPYISSWPFYVEISGDLYIHGPWIGFKWNHKEVVCFLYYFVLIPPH